MGLGPISWDEVTNIGSSVLGGFANIFGSSNANATNERLARENRDWQTSENQKNRDFTLSQNKESRAWQEKMWNLQNQYNTPSAMMSRYREAGLNPYVLGGNSPAVGAAGSAGSAPQGSPSSVGSPALPNIQPVRYGDALGGIGNAILNAKAVDANVANQRAQGAKAVAEASKTVYESQGRKAAGQFLKTYMPTTASDFDPDYAPAYRNLNNEVRRTELANSYQELQNQILKDFGAKKEQSMITQIDSLTSKYVAELGQVLANIEVSKASVKQIYAKCKELGANAARALSAAGLDNANAATINAVREYVVNKAQNDSLISDWESEQKFYETTEKRSEWIYNAPWRDFMESDLGSAARKAAIFNDKKVNPVFGFLDGFTSSLNLSGSVGAGVVKKVK